MKAPALVLAALMMGGLTLSSGTEAVGDDTLGGLMSDTVDPPLIVTNLSGEAVALQWQTAHPGALLTPPRSATVEAGATAHRIDPGLFWIVSRRGGEELLVENDVYVSRLDGDRFAAQAVFRTDGFATLEEVKASALAVTIEADGSIALATVPAN